MLCQWKVKIYQVCAVVVFQLTLSYRDTVVAPPVLTLFKSLPHPCVRPHTVDKCYPSVTLSEVRSS